MKIVKPTEIPIAVDMEKQTVGNSGKRLKIVKPSKPPVAAAVDKPTVSTVGVTSSSPQTPKGSPNKTNNGASHPVAKSGNVPSPRQQTKMPTLVADQSQPMKRPTLVADHSQATDVRSRLGNKVLIAEASSSKLRHVWFQNKAVYMTASVAELRSPFG